MPNNQQQAVALGRDILAEIGDRTKLLNDILVCYPDLTAARATGLTERALDIANTVAWLALEHDPPTSHEDLRHRLNERDSQAILDAHMAAAAYTLMEETDGGPEYPKVKRALVRIREPHVVYRSRKLRGDWQRDIKPTDGMPLASGRLIAGKVRRFYAAPRLGGLIVIGGVARDSYLHGLVNPRTGEPNVELQLHTSKTQ